MIYFITSNKNKISQWKESIPNFIKMKTILYEIPEEKINNAELVLLKKLIHLKNKNFPDLTIAEDRALCLKKDLPGPNIKAFIRDESLFYNYFKGSKGFLVFDFGYLDKEFIHIHIGKIGVKVEKKGQKNRWLPLGKYLTPIGFDKPYSDFSEKEELILNRKISKIFENFLSSLLKNPNKEFFVNDPYINKSRIFFKNYFKNGIIESLKRYVSKIIKNEEVNEMTLRNRILLSLSYYPPNSFFDIDVKKSFRIPDTGEIKRGFEIIHKIYEFHKDRLKKENLKTIKLIEDKEHSEKETCVKIKMNKIFIRGEEYFFREISEDFAKEVYTKLHYLSSYRKNIKTYGIVNKDDIPVAMISIAKVERNYKKYCLNHDGISALEFTRAYNSLYKVKGILSLLFSKVRKLYPNTFFLTAYQPNFSSGINIYGSGFSPYIIKPQQNFFIFKTFKGERIPVFTVRRELRNKTYEIGKMPLIPSFEMIYPNVPWIHYTDKILS